MDFNTQIGELLKKTKRHTDVSLEELKEMVSLIDLTSLNPVDTEESIQNLCSKADTAIGMVAGICVYPQFVLIASKAVRKKPIKVVSVANFPTGNGTLQTTAKEIDLALSQGANEIDLVFPHQLYLQGKRKEALEFVTQCKKICAKHILKVILEVSEFDELETLYLLSKEVIEAGSDFIKTSTGKSKHGATLESSSVMLLAIKSCKKSAGFKPAGGIKTVEQAFSYMDLVKDIMGSDWIKPRHFRIGATGLLDNILQAASR